MPHTNNRVQDCIYVQKTRGKSDHVSIQGQNWIFRNKYLSKQCYKDRWHANAKLLCTSSIIAFFFGLGSLCSNLNYKPQTESHQQRLVIIQGGPLKSSPIS